MGMLRKSGAAGLILGLMFAAGQAFALTPANTALTNEARLVYDGNPVGITSSVTVTVQLVPAAVSIAATQPAPSASVSRAENQAYTETYFVQTNANGPDSYTIAAAYTNTNDITGEAAPTTSIATVTLGATASSVAALAAATAISVPSDGTGAGGNTPVNEIETGDTVVINGAVYVVASTVDNATGNSTINLATGLLAPMAVGDGIFEYSSFTTDVTDVGVQNPGTVFILELQTTVTSDTAPNPVFTFDVDINVVTITINKFVRNETAGACVTVGCGVAAQVVYDAGSGNNTYYDQGVEAAPGETLEYLLVITTTAAGISTAVITDVLPEFTSYVAASTTLNAIAVDDEAGPPVFPLDSGADNGGLLIDDNLARVAGTEGTGTIGTAETVRVAYQVTVD